MSAREDLDSDLQDILSNNGLGDKVDLIARVDLQISGENDGPNWHWIVQLKDDTWAYVSGGREYTGWDCQSDWEAAPTREATIALAGDDERRVFEDMISKGESKRTNTGGL